MCNYTDIPDDIKIEILTYLIPPDECSNFEQDTGMYIKNKEYLISLEKTISSMNNEISKFYKGYKWINILRFEPNIYYNHIFDTCFQSNEEYDNFILNILYLQNKHISDLYYKDVLMYIMSSRENIMTMLKNKINDINHDVLKILL